MNSFVLPVCIGLAGSLGAVTRYLVTCFIINHSRSQFPLATLFINVLGAFLIGLLFSLTTQKIMIPLLQSILATGFLGGFTTFNHALGRDTTGTCWQYWSELSVLGWVICAWPRRCSTWHDAWKESLMPGELSLPRRILAVFLGGFLGTIARYLLSLLIQSYLGRGWPYDILLINLTGAFLLALFTTLADAAMFIGPTRRLFLNVGFLGAYTIDV